MVSAGKYDMICKPDVANPGQMNPTHLVASIVPFEPSLTLSDDYGIVSKEGTLRTSTAWLSRYLDLLFVEHAAVS